MPDVWVTKRHCRLNMQHGPDDVCSTKLPYTENGAHPPRPPLTAKGYCLETHAKRLLEKAVNSKSGSKTAVLCSRHGMDEVNYRTRHRFEYHTHIYCPTPCTNTCVVVTNRCGQLFYFHIF